MFALFTFFESFIRLSVSSKKSIGGSDELSALSRCHGLRKILWPPWAFLRLEMHLLRRDRWPGNPGKSSLEKIILPVCLLPIQKDENDETLMRSVVPYSGNAGQSEMSQLFQRKGKTLPRRKQRERSLHGVRLSIWIQSWISKKVGLNFCGGE